MLADAIVPKNASETALSPTGQWFFVLRHARRRHDLPPPRSTTAPKQPVACDRGGRDEPM